MKAKKNLSSLIYEPKALIACRREMEGIQGKKLFSLILFLIENIYIYTHKILAPKLGTFLTQLQQIPLTTGLPNSLHKITTSLIPFFHTHDKISLKDLSFFLKANHFKQNIYYNTNL